ncbi:MAG: hypothetical protein HQL25_04250 [Candidatus Omnitrophica bacterium]|nr:hypothetical protein [Candidatus Omnitrophota bacterium]
MPVVSNVQMPVLIQGMTIDKQNPFHFNFIVDRGDVQLTDAAFKVEAEKLINYFMAGLTVPEKDLWVNLSPKEKERIIPEGFDRTLMGQDMLAQDYILKQLTASLLNPDNETGRTFWDEIYSKIYEIRGKEERGREVSEGILSRVWIVPDKVSVVVKGNSVYVDQAKFKVMTEGEYLAGGSPVKTLRDHGVVQSKDGGSEQQAIKQIIIPILTKKVNEGKEFAPLRQIFHSLILAGWYKRHFSKNALGRQYADQKKTEGLIRPEKDFKGRIFNNYSDIFKKGSVNAIREEYDPNTQTIIPRKYFSGGVQVDLAMLQEENDYLDGVDTINRGLKSRPLEDVSVDLEMIPVRHSTDPIKEMMLQRLNWAARNMNGQVLGTRLNLGDDIFLWVMKYPKIIGGTEYTQIRVMRPNYEYTTLLVNLKTAKIRKNDGIESIEDGPFHLEQHENGVLLSILEEDVYKTVLLSEAPEHKYEDSLEPQKLVLNTKIRDGHPIDVELEFDGKAYEKLDATNGVFMKIGGIELKNGRYYVVLKNVKFSSVEENGTKKPLSNLGVMSNVLGYIVAAMPDRFGFIFEEVRSDDGTKQILDKQYSFLKRTSKYREKMPLSFPDSLNVIKNRFDPQQPEQYKDFMSYMYIGLKGSPIGRTLHELGLDINFDESNSNSLHAFAEFSPAQWEKIIAPRVYQEIDYAMTGNASQKLTKQKFTELIYQNIARMQGIVLGVTLDLGDGLRVWFTKEPKMVNGKAYLRLRLDDNKSVKSFYFDVNRGELLDESLQPFKNDKIFVSPVSADGLMLSINGREIVIDKNNVLNFEQKWDPRPLSLNISMNTKKLNIGFGFHIAEEEAYTLEGGHLNMFMQMSRWDVDEQGRAIIHLPYAYFNMIRTSSILKQDLSGMGLLQVIMRMFLEGFPFPVIFYVDQVDNKQTREAVDQAYKKWKHVFPDMPNKFQGNMGEYKKLLRGSYTDFLSDMEKSLMDTPFVKVFSSAGYDKFSFSERGGNGNFGIVASISDKAMQAGAVLSPKNLAVVKKVKQNFKDDPVALVSAQVKGGQGRISILNDPIFIDNRPMYPLRYYMGMERYDLLYDPDKGKVLIPRKAKSLISLTSVDGEKVSLSIGDGTIELSRRNIFKFDPKYIPEVFEWRIAGNGTEEYFGLHMTVNGQLLASKYPAEIEGTFVGNKVKLSYKLKFLSFELKDVKTGVSYDLRRNGLLTQVFRRILKSAGQPIDIKIEDVTNKPTKIKFYLALKSFLLKKFPKVTNVWEAKRVHYTIMENLKQKTGAAYSSVMRQVAAAMTDTPFIRSLQQAGYSLQRVKVTADNRGLSIEASMTQSEWKEWIKKHGDRAINVSDQVGGIDLNPEKYSVTEQGDSAMLFDGSATSQNYETENVLGFIPVISSITPINLNGQQSQHFPSH